MMLADSLFDSGEMARHALVDISQIFNTSPLQHDRSRMTDQDLIQLRSQLLQREVTLSDEAGDDKTLEDLRALYEPYTQVLSRYLIMPLPEWLPKSRTSDNWQTSAFEIRSPAPDQPFKACMLKQPTPSRARAAFHKED